MKIGIGVAPARSVDGDGNGVMAKIIGDAAASKRGEIKAASRQHISNGGACEIKSGGSAYQRNSIMA